MTVDWTKPIEAVEKATGRVVPMTFYKTRKAGSIGGNYPLNDDYYTTEAPCNATSNSGWNADGSDHCGCNAWFIRNVEPQSRTFANDHRDNPELHKLYVGWALDILETVSDSIARLDDFSNWNASQFAAELRKTRAKLVKEDAAFFEAAAISYAGRDWLDAVEE